jgi:fatty-acid peroxygenase
MRSLLLEGYGWLPNRRRATPDGIARTRLLGQRATGVCGPEAARFFYDESNVHRDIPEPIQSTLFGHGAVHTLNGTEHRCRKEMFLSLVNPDQIVDLVTHTLAAWDSAPWLSGQKVVLFDVAAQALTRGVCRWAGVPLADSDVAALAADLVAMVDGFATLGPRHWRARRARERREAWLSGLIENVRRGKVNALPGTAVDVIARHEISPEVAAVELLNVIRPTVAVSWFVAFAGHALHRWPENREPLAAGGGVFTEAFTHEIRRFYPFAPFLAGRAVRDLTWQGHSIPAGTLVLLDVYGQNHDPRLWHIPYTFDPARFAGHKPGEFDLIPQGGGDPRLGHRCPGEAYTTALLEALTVRLARLDYGVPRQNLKISLSRIPARVKSGFVMEPRASVNGHLSSELQAADIVRR